MKEIPEIDKLLRSKMEEYHPKPLPISREKFLTEGANLLPKPSFFGNRMIWLTIILFLFFGIGGVVYLTLINDQNTSDNRAMIITNQPIISEQSNMPIEESLSIENTQAATSSLDSNNPELNSIVNSNKKTKFNVVDVSNSDFSTHYEVERERQLPSLSSTSLDSYNLLIADSSVELINNSDKENYNSEIELSEKEIVPQSETNASNNHFQYDLYYRPEIIFNAIDSKKLVNSFGAEIQYRFFNKKYLIRTGIGLSLSQGYYEYIIEYQEHLGSFKMLDSVTFSLASDKFHLVPSYFYSEEDVFDTAITNYATKYYKQFTYLQIPLIMGYDFIRKDNFSAGIRIGPLLSLLLNNKSTEVDYDPGKNKLLQINKITPDRINTNWQFVVGFNTTFYSGDYLFFEVEPRFTYYFNSVYQQSDNTHPPYGLGLRLSVGLK